MKTVDVKPYEKNAKKHPEWQVDQIAASIKQFGFNQPIVVDANGVIIVGHGRFMAAKLLGLEEIPTIQLNLTENQAKAYRLADNKLNQTPIDMDIVIEELRSLEAEMTGFIEFTGYDKNLLDPDFEPTGADGRLDQGKQWMHKCTNCGEIRPFNKKDLIPAQ